MNRTSLPAALPLSLLVLLAAAGASADIYTYTDSNGVIHFTNNRAESRDAKLYIKSSPKPRLGAAVPVMPSDTSPERFARHEQTIREAAALYQIPVELVRAVIKVESDFDPRAVSIAGARGLMQLIPATAERMMVKDVFDPRENIFGGVRYLRVLANTFNGDIILTVAGYNAGESAIMRHGGIPPYEETRAYVVKVLAYYHRYRVMSDLVAASGGGYTENPTAPRNGETALTPDARRLTP
jgi:soluble lytic murein transglycosylase-like protein